MCSVLTQAKNLEVISVYKSSVHMSHFRANTLKEFFIILRLNEAMACVSSPVNQQASIFISEWKTLIWCEIYFILYHYHTYTYFNQSMTMLDISFIRIMCTVFFLYVMCPFRTLLSTAFYNFLPFVDLFAISCKSCSVFHSFSFAKEVARYFPLSFLPSFSIVTMKLCVPEISTVSSWF